MEHLHALLLTFLEMTFIFAGLGLLHSQRRSIGQSPFYMALGLLLLFSHFVIAADCRVVLYGPVEFSVGSAALFLPVLAALLMVYISEGTLATQRIIIGFLALFGLYLYLGEITRLQCNWMGFSLSSGISAPLLDNLLGETRNSMNLMLFVNLVEFFLLPIVYTRLKNLRLNRFLAIEGAFVASQLVSLILFMPLAEPLQLDETFLLGNFIAESAGLLWLGFLLWLYLEKIVGDVRSGEKSPLDIIVAFFGSYGRSKELEANLREWEDRYQVVLENAGEMILMLSPSGRIIDANISAAKHLGVQSPRELVTRHLFRRMRVAATDSFDLSRIPAQLVQFQCVIRDFKEQELLFSCSLSPIRMRGQLLLVMIARDITQETRLAREREELREHLIHSQRIESLGMLAGGIAHDFNNYIHAILGHVDVITMLYPSENPEVTRHLEKVAAIAEQAGNLTSQLLGFARKGKYQLATLDPIRITEDSLALLGPRKSGNIKLTMEIPPGLFIRGDAIQMQQVFLNLLLNALDAMDGREEERKLRIFGGEAVDAPVALTPPPERKIEPGKFIFIAFSDNGCGMDDETRVKIFEPFFTTKPVGSGTGMGLAMVYGTITNHQGWIQVESTPGIGTTFYLFLPHAPQEEPPAETTPKQPA